MKIAIGSDKSGFSAKEAIKAYLTEAGVEFDEKQALSSTISAPPISSRFTPIIRLRARLLPWFRTVPMTRPS